MVFFYYYFNRLQTPEDTHAHSCLWRVVFFAFFSQVTTDQSREPVHELMANVIWVICSPLDPPLCLTGTLQNKNRPHADLCCFNPLGRGEEISDKDLCWVFGQSPLFRCREESITSSVRSVVGAVEVMSEVREQHILLCVAMEVVQEWKKRKRERRVEGSGVEGRGQKQ